MIPPPGYVTLGAVIAIAVLEAINIIITGHNGTILEISLVAIAGLGGWGAHVTFLHAKEQQRVKK